MDDNQSKIEEIASKVLGKTSDGQTMMRYETPDQVDKSLLVGIPRNLNRTHYNIAEQPEEFIGIDTWNSYEFSCLLDNGFPISGWLRWSYTAHSENIVESKSAKLYSSAQASWRDRCRVTHSPKSFANSNCSCGKNSWIRHSLMSSVTENIRYGFSPTTPNF